ncbi:HET domain-containing protein [Colletotrichum sojae]|uniref:HET domain-containing protein n=1 Tax=Colletotrichum sojae TaxID=2175907 RepID=A0A8H6JLJ4_9PEZI|nr:HET domain-containing protein [Colletotrichum sojae]
MRLINTSRLELTEFLVDVPPYAILSHTWSKDEVLFQDFASTRDEKAPSPKAGWKKVLAACELARILDHGWIWIDTCCIDKSSSAELSEAINSMFKWYGDATVCIAYLADVSAHNDPSLYADLTHSRWFTRGWTLQELLAPVRLNFYSAEWISLGSRARFAAAIEERTQIDAGFLQDWHVSLSAASVAERMCWASKRKTTRPEDLAYCLLGIFDVNIPLIYGEGAGAFKRLQEAILRQTDDQSIFAWGSLPNEGWPPALSASQANRPLLADSPSRFAGSGDIVPFAIPGFRAGLRLEHDGVVLSTPLWKPGRSARVEGRGGAAADSLFLAPLRCRRKKDFFDCIAICLRGTAGGDGHGQQESEKNLARGSGSWDSCHRLSEHFFLAPRTAWRTASLCEAFVHFDPSPLLQTLAALGNPDLLLDRGCVIRSLPPTYAAVSVFSASRGFRGEMPVLFPYTSAIPGAHGLAEPVVVRLQTGTYANGWEYWRTAQYEWSLDRREPDLALVLQFQYLSVQVENRPLFPSQPGWMVNRVVRIPEGATLTDVADWVVEESRRQGAVVDVDGQEGGAGDMAAVRTFPPRTTTTTAASSSSLETFEGFRLSLTVEPAFGPRVFVVDVADSEGRSVSRAASALDDDFEPVRG